MLATRSAKPPSCCFSTLSWLSRWYACHAASAAFTRASASFKRSATKASASLTVSPATRFSMERLGS